MATASPPLHAYSDAPEVLLTQRQESGLETVEHSTLEHVGAGGEAWKYAGQPYSTLQIQDQSMEGWKQVVDTPTPGSPTEDTPVLPGNGRGVLTIHRRRRKWYILGGIGGILAIIAIIVGCVVGLRNRDGGNRSVLILTAHTITSEPTTNNPQAAAPTTPPPPPEQVSAATPSVRKSSPSRRTTPRAGSSSSHAARTT